MKIQTIWSMYRFYRSKRKKLETDIEIPFVPQLSIADYNNRVIQLTLSSGHVGRYLFIEAGHFSKGHAHNARFDLIGVVGKPDIRRCSFMEFLQQYPPEILDSYVTIYNERRK